MLSLILLSLLRGRLFVSSMRLFIFLCSLLSVIKFEMVLFLFSARVGFSPFAFASTAMPVSCRFVVFFVVTMVPLIITS